MPLRALPPIGPLTNTVAERAIQKMLAPALVVPPAKPWKQPKPIPRIYRQLRSTPAHVSRPTIGPEWDGAPGAYDTDVQEEWEHEWARESQDDTDEEDVRGQVEMQILNIAKPAKPRGGSLLFRAWAGLGVDNGFFSSLSRPGEGVRSCRDDAQGDHAGGGRRVGGVGYWVGGARIRRMGGRRGRGAPPCIAHYGVAAEPWLKSERRPLTLGNIAV